MSDMDSDTQNAGGWAPDDRTPREQARRGAGSQSTGGQNTGGQNTGGGQHMGGGDRARSASDLDSGAPDRPEASPEAGAEGEELATLRAEAERLRDQHLRALAEAENIRRRAQREKEDTAKYAVSNFARDLLSAADNLRRALDAVPQGAAGADPALAALAEGVAATERELLGAFEKHGLTRIEAMGQKFDPNLHQAMFELENTGRPSGTVVQEIQAGYLLAGRLLRPALVGIAKGDPARVDRTV